MAIAKLKSSKSESKKLEDDTKVKATVEKILKEVEANGDSAIRQLSKKFDKDLNYIKKWVPNFQNPDYARPIVNHKEARERCLNTYKAALNKV